jgi:dCTP deaminase
MILSNVSIQRALDKGWLIIDPEPSPRKKTAESAECPYQTSAVDLRLGNEIAYFESGKIAANIDLRKAGFATIFGPHSKSVTITDDQPYVLTPGKLVLAKTLERVELPIIQEAPCLAARIEGRSSYARCGMLVHFTAPTIHAGFVGTITLEIINLGPLAITLAPGAPICQLIVEQVDGMPFRNDSQFQDQDTAGGKRRAGPAPYLPKAKPVQSKRTRGRSR